MSSNIASDLSNYNLLNEQLQQDELGYSKLEEILRRHTGIHMPANEKNKALMASRLISILKAQNLKSYRDYARKLNVDDSPLLKEFIESLTTNKTEFFREPKHFDIFSNELPKILDQNRSQGRRELRIWCAAASTGQEPYTIAIKLLETVPELSQWSIKFLASDIDTQVLKKAAMGIYLEREYEGLSRELIAKYFTPTIFQGQKALLANNELRHMITFAPFNLMTDPFPFEHKFDVIFCRNVLIYFDRPTGTSVVARLCNALRTDGILFVGHTESGISKPSYMKTLDVAAYKSNKNNE